MSRLGPFVSALLPLVVFYAVDAVWGLRPALLASIALAVAELAVTYARRRRVDRMTLFGAGLVIVLGGLSLVGEDDRFMLYTPVIGDVVFAAVLFGSVWRGQPLLRALAEQQDPEAAAHPARAAFLRGMTIRLGLNMLVHAAVCVWATTRSRDTWIFVSGVLQYIFLGVQVAVEVVWARLVVLPRIDDSE